MKKTTEETTRQILLSILDPNPETKRIIEKIGLRELIENGDKMDIEIDTKNKIKALKEYLLLRGKYGRS